MKVISLFSEMVYVGYKNVDGIDLVFGDRGARGEFNWRLATMTFLFQSCSRQFSFHFRSCAFLDFDFLAKFLLPAFFL